MKIFKIFLALYSSTLLAQAPKEEAKKDEPSRFNQEYYQNLHELNGTQNKSEEDKKTFLFKVKTGAVKLDVDEKNLHFTSPLVGAGVEYFLAKNWTVDTSLEQALLSGSSITSVFYAYDLNINYGLFGNITSRSKVNKTLNYQMTEKEKFGGLKLSMGLRQYFVNTVPETQFYSGAGAGVSYQFSLFGQYFELAFTNDVISNGKDILTPQKLYLNLLFF